PIYSRKRKTRKARVLRPLVGIHIHEIHHQRHWIGRTHILRHGGAVSENPVVGTPRHGAPNLAIQYLRIEVRNGQWTPGEQIWQLRHLHRPTRLEVERAGVALAAAEIKTLKAFLATLLNQLPVHEIVGRIAIKLVQGTNVKRHYRAFEIPAERAGYRPRAFA